MATNALNTNQILQQIKQLNITERITILENLVLLIKQDLPAKKTGGLSSLSGLGSEIWKGENLDSYIENERKWE